MMGHLVGKDIYRQLGQKIDSLTVRVPWNETLYQILKELYSEQEAEIIARMPWGLSSFDKIARVTKKDKIQLKKILDTLCAKGLVVDLWLREKYRYMIAPMVIGIFEFTMMRTGNHLNVKKLAKLFNDYLLGDPAFFEANFKHGETTTLARALPHEGTIRSEDYVEVLDYEKATCIVNEADKFSIGICSCRHEKHHLGEKKCTTPLDTCSSFGPAADYLIRNKLAREVSKSEMLENLARSKELGLVFNADNVQQRVSFICHCCGCCCNMLLGISRLGLTNVVKTSNFIARPDSSKCIGCRQCQKACPIHAIEMVSNKNENSKIKFNSQVNSELCLGCGVCSIKCSSGAMKLAKRDQRVIYPETTFERVILQCLDRGTLQNQLFDDPSRLSHQFMRAFVGAFLKLPPVKKALMSNILRSAFLSSLTKGASSQGKDFTKEI